MNVIKMDKDKLLKRLSSLFGSYRAEWSRRDMFRHFSEPAYFSDLVNFRPCILQGGRGSGKTTALKGLTYQGQYELIGSDINRFDSEVPFVGLYHRVDTNHVRAFSGGNLEEADWRRLFGHYFNLIFIADIVEFLNWHCEKNNNDEVLSADEMRQILKRLCINVNCTCYMALGSIVNEAVCEFQNVINNIGSYDQSKIQLSLIGEPIDFILSRISRLAQFRNKCFYLLLDEYENFEDYQQVVINTLIKHAAKYFTFKIGVKEAGWRKKHTLDKNEWLYDPADYALIDINRKLGEGNKFFEFAKSVCEKRFEILNGGTPFDVVAALESLTIEDMAIRLGVETNDLLKGYDDLPLPVLKQLGDISPLYKFVIASWAKAHKTSLVKEVQNVINNRETWNTRYNNYKYHFLFKIRTGRGSGRSGHRQMLYCGFETYTKLASNNIRFLMELIYKTFERHIEMSGGLSSQVRAEIQTEAAILIGEKNLAQLECVEKDGPRIVRLLCGLGRVFECLAKDKNPGTPEVTQFFIQGGDCDDEVDKLLSVAVKNLALLRSPGNKLDGAQTKAYDYSIHPIFAPFFIFSYRRKRKMPLLLPELKGLSEQPSTFVDTVLHRYKNCESSDGVPQLLFGL